MSLEFSIRICNKNEDKYYKIYHFQQNNEDLENKFWLQNNEGEGGTFDCQELYELIDKYFKEKY